MALQSIPGQPNPFTPAAPFSSPTIQTPYNNPANYQTPAQYPVMNRQVLGSSSVNNGASSNNNASQAPSGPSLQDSINSIYAPVNDYLNQAQQNVQSAYPQIQSDINSQYQTSAASLGQQNTQGNQQLDSQQTTADQGKQNAMDAAVKLYNELQRGGVQRFGGSSSAGQGYSELTAQQLQQQQGQVQQQYGNTVQQLNVARQTLQDKYGLALRGLEDQKNSALNQAQQEYNDRLLQISQDRAQNESSKSSAQMEALQSLRNQVFSINLQSLQNSQAVNGQYQANQSAINDYINNASQALSGGSNALNGFLANASTNPQNSYTVGYAPPASADTYQPTGSVTSSGRKTDIYGNPIS